MTDVRIEVAKALETLPAWRADDGDRPAIARSLRFADFNAAFGFMTRVALMADKIYDRVEVLLTTHDADGVTDKDVALARFIDRAAAETGANS